MNASAALVKKGEKTIREGRLGQKGAEKKKRESKKTDRLTILTRSEKKAREGFSERAGVSQHLDDVQAE